jgi:DNA-binding NtrC family response regulator
MCREPYTTSIGRASMTTTARQPNVLLVEDEEFLRALASDRLRDEGFRVLEAAAAADAIALLEEHPEIDVLFTDVDMPGPVDGLGLAAQARRRRPHLHVIMTSGQWTATTADVPEGAMFVQKPYSLEAVARLVKALVKAR